MQMKLQTGLGTTYQVESQETSLGMVMLCKIAGGLLGNLMVRQEETGRYPLCLESMRRISQGGGDLEEAEEIVYLDDGI